MYSVRSRWLAKKSGVQLNLDPRTSITPGERSWTKYSRALLSPTSLATERLSDSISFRFSVCRTTPYSRKSTVITSTCWSENVWDASNSPGLVR